MQPPPRTWLLNVSKHAYSIATINSLKNHSENGGYQTPPRDCTSVMQCIFVSLNQNQSVQELGHNSSFNRLQAPFTSYPSSSRVCLDSCQLAELDAMWGDPSPSHALAVLLIITVAAFKPGHLAVTLKGQDVGGNPTRRRR